MSRTAPRAESPAAFTVRSEWAIALLALVAAIWLGFAVTANRDAAPGRYALFMDEIVTYDGIAAIHGAKSPTEFVKAVSGPDQRYGRPTWYVPALLSAPFAAIGGETARIVAVRMVFVTALLSAFILLALALIENWPWRVAAFAAAATTPFAVYYATMPKPEPFLLLFVAIFFFLMRREKNLGLSWIFLGLAFGEKISLAPTLPFFFALAFAREWGAGKSNLAQKSGVSLLAFLAGWVIAVPILVTPKGFETYVDYTWENTGHLGSDNAGVTPASWIGLMADEGFFGSGILSWVMLATMILFGAFGAFTLVRRLAVPEWRARIREAATDRLFLGLATTAIGFILMAAIAIGVKRLWGFYLFPGAILMLFGAFAVIESLSDRLKRPASLVVTVLGGVLFLAAFSAGAPKTISKFFEASERSAQPQYAIQLAQYHEFTTTAESLSQRLDKPITVMVHASFFSPTSTPTVRYSPLYGVHNIWVENYELIFLDKDPDPKSFENTIGDYGKSLVEFFAQRQEHLAAAPGKPCKVTPCYVVLPTKSEGLYGWVRADVAEATMAPRKTGRP